MIRVHVVCEGQTEEIFVKELLQPEFSAKSIATNLADIESKAETVRAALCQAFAESIGKPELKQALLGISAEFATPEHINDSPQTAPSKRIEQVKFLASG